MELLAALIGAVIYAVPTYWAKRPKGEVFQARKAVRTVLVALMVGGIAYWKGDILTAENFELYVMANSSAILVFDQGFKYIYRKIDAYMVKRLDE